MITKPHSTLHIYLSVVLVCKVYKTIFQHIVAIKLDFTHIFPIESKCKSVRQDDGNQ